jgi:hypothetical protein
MVGKMKKPAPKKKREEEMVWDPVLEEYVPRSEFEEYSESDYLGFHEDEC